MKAAERTHHHLPSTKPHNTKIQYFANLMGENFLAWRSQFQVIADNHCWSDEEAKQLVYAYNGVRHGHPPYRTKDCCAGVR